MHNWNVIHFKLIHSSFLFAPSDTVVCTNFGDFGPHYLYKYQSLKSIYFCYTAMILWYNIHSFLTMLSLNYQFTMALYFTHYIDSGSIQLPVQWFCFYSSIKMAHCYPDLAGEIDVISDSEVSIKHIWFVSHFGPFWMADKVCDTTISLMMCLTPNNNLTLNIHCNVSI